MDEIKKMAAGHSIEVLDAIMTEVEEARGEHDNLGERLDEMSSDTPTPSTAAPAMDGTAAAGTSTDYARADHVHPSDTSKQDTLNAAQLAAVNSGIDSAKVEQIETNKNNISLNWTKSKNILNIYTSPTTTSKTVVFTNNQDGSYDIDGTATDNDCYITLKGAYNIVPDFIVAGNTYVITTNSDAVTLNIVPWISTAQSTIVGKKSAPAIWTVPNNLTGCMIRLATTVAAGAHNHENVVPSIALQSEWDSAPTIQPYAMSNVELTAAIQALQAQLANQ